MTPIQVRMARAALDLSTTQLAERAAVSAEAIEAIETGGGSPEAEAKLRTTLEAGGIEFLGEDGVRHRSLAMPGRGAIPVETLNSANDE